MFKLVLQPTPMLFVPDSNLHSCRFLNCFNWINIGILYHNSKKKIIILLSSESWKYQHILFFVAISPFTNSKKADKGIYFWCVCVCVRACVCACVSACVCLCVCLRCVSEVCVSEFSRPYYQTKLLIVFSFLKIVDGLHGKCKYYVFLETCLVTSPE